MTPAERARQIDKEEFAAECAAIRQRAFAYVARRRQDARASIDCWLGRPAPAVMFNPGAPITPKRPTGKRTGPGFGHNAKRYDFNGYTRTLDEWAEVTGISRHTIRSRLSNGWTIDRALTATINEAGKRMHKARRPGVVCDLSASLGTGGGTHA